MPTEYLTGPLELKMQIETRVAATYSKDTGLSGSEYPKLAKSQKFRHPGDIQAKHLTRESKVDQMSASVVIGLTGLFIAFMFGWVTRLIPNLGENLLLSLFMGLCVGVIAFALMKEED